MINLDQKPNFSIEFSLEISIEFSFFSIEISLEFCDWKKTKFYWNLGIFKWRLKKSSAIDFFKWGCSGIATTRRSEADSRWPPESAKSVAHATASRNPSRGIRGLMLHRREHKVLWDALARDASCGIPVHEPRTSAWWMTADIGWFLQ